MGVKKENKVLNSERKNDASLSLIERYRKGDEAAFDSLAEMYKPLLVSMASACFPGLSSFCEWEDILQYALIAFSKAVMSYNTEQKSVSFGLYAKVCIGNALVSKLRSSKKKNIELIAADVLFDMPDTDDVLGDIIDRENAERLHELIKSTLSDFENKVFKLYAYGYSSSEIADRLGKTEKSVDNAIFRARNKLKHVLNGSKS